MRIALIAMSGIRACDEELLRLGLTLPGFVERSKTIASLPSLGLLTLAALTPPEHDIQYIEVPDLAKLSELPDGFDLVAISSYSAQIREAYELGRRYREMGVPVVIGGPHVIETTPVYERYVLGAQLLDLHGNVDSGIATSDDHHAAPNREFRQVLLANPGNVVNGVVHTFNIFVVQGEPVHIVVPQGEEYRVEFLPDL